MSNDMFNPKPFDTNRSSSNYGLFHRKPFDPPRKIKYNEQKRPVNEGKIGGGSSNGEVVGP